MTYHEDVATVISYAHEVTDLTTWELAVVSAYYQAPQRRSATVQSQIGYRFGNTLRTAFDKINHANTEIFHRRLQEHLS